MAAATGATIRWYFQEHNNKCKINSLDFDGDATWCLQELGRQDAQDSLTIGQPFIQSAVKAWNADSNLQKEFPYVLDYIKSIRD